jgi:hypothetical protein
MICKIYITLILNQVFFRLKNVLQNQDLQIDIAVNITAIWKDSHTVGYISKNGNIYSCTNVDSNKPEPTSINVSKRFLIIKLRPTRKEIQKREPKLTNN